MTDVSKTWPEWTDMLGNVYRPGDYVIYAGMAGQSAQLTFAQVLKINRVNSKGEEIRQGGRYDYKLKRRMDDEPGCTVQLQPIEDSRFSRWSSRNGEAPKKVTIKIPRNIVKVDNNYVTLFEQIKAGYSDAVR